MARQRGLQKYSGSMDDVTYYKLNGKYYARKKSSLSKEDVMTKKAFAKSRKASAQFGKASTANKLIRTSLMEGIPFSRKTEIHNKLMPYIRKFITAAASVTEKSIRLNQLPWQELKGFEFNKETTLTGLASYLGQPVVTTDLKTGQIKVQING